VFKTVGPATGKNPGTTVRVESTAMHNEPVSVGAERIADVEMRIGRAGVMRHERSVQESSQHRCSRPLQAGRRRRRCPVANLTMID